MARIRAAPGTKEAQVLYLEIANMVCERIAVAITEAHAQERPVEGVLDPFNPAGSTDFVNFTTSKTTWTIHPRRCHINHVVCDDDWKAEFCRLVETHPRVLAYAKNRNLGLEVSYRSGSIMRRYLPDFIVLVDDGAPDPRGCPMKLHYYPETDSLCIELRPEPGTEVWEVADGLNVDLSAAGEVVGFDIDHAPQRLDLTTLEPVALPLKTIRAA